MTQKTRLALIERALLSLTSWKDEIMTDVTTIKADIAALNVQVAKNTASENTALGLLQALSALIADLKSKTLVTAQDLTDIENGVASATVALTASATALDAGVVANTPGG